MQTTLLAAAVTLITVPTLDARYMPSANGVDPVDPIIAPDLRLRMPNGRLRPDLSSGSGAGALNFESPNLRDARPPAPRPWILPDPKPITPEGDGEFPAIHHVPKPDSRFPAPMPVAKGEFIDPRMPMKMPDPAVDYKLHVREALETSAVVRAKK